MTWWRTLDGAKLSAERRLAVDTLDDIAVAFDDLAAIAETLGHDALADRMALASAKALNQSRKFQEGF